MERISLNIKSCLRLISLCSQSSDFMINSLLFGLRSNYTLRVGTVRPFINKIKQSEKKDKIRQEYEKARFKYNDYQTALSGDPEFLGLCATLPLKFSYITDLIIPTEILALLFNPFQITVMSNYLILCDTEKIKLNEFPFSAYKLSDEFISYAKRTDELKLFNTDFYSTMPGTVPFIKIPCNLEIDSICKTISYHCIPDVNSIVMNEKNINHSIYKKNSNALSIYSDNIEDHVDIEKFNIKQNIKN